MAEDTLQQDFNDAWLAIKIFDEVAKEQYQTSSIVWADYDAQAGVPAGKERSYAALRLKKARVDGLGIKGTLELKSRPVAIAKEESGAYVCIFAFYREVNDGQTATDSEKKEE